MNAFDLIILAILVTLTLRGIWKGMVSQIVSVASFFVCWIVASRFGSLVAPTIPLEAPWNQVAAMAIIFLITLVAMRFTHAVLEKLIKDWHLAKLNSLSGGILGFFKGLLLCLIITFFAVMVSVTSRDVVFSAKTGPSLVRLITQIGVFVPKDSYEFVHSQLAQFQEKVNEAVPGQTPETLQVQSSEAVKRVLAQLQEAEIPQDVKASSLMSAISNWWNGTQANAAESDAEVATPIQQMAQSAQVREPSLPSVATYVPPSLPTIPQSTLPQPTIPYLTSEDHFFIQRPETADSSQQTQPVVPLSIPATPKPSLSAPLTPLSPLSEITMPSNSQLYPNPIVQRHVGSEQLLRNSSQTTNFGSSARVFQAN